MDDSRKMSWVINNLNAFYAHESCGRCAVPRGIALDEKISDRIVAGFKAVPKDVDLLLSVASQIEEARRSAPSARRARGRRASW
ncbi:MAG: NADH-ubiquinone oxidoreductase-F iron-sulfur binding region domain-containing protein [Verrucomicrobiales bacterium]